MTTGEKRPKPIPRPNDMTQPFWSATKEGKLALQRCNDCGYYNHPPKSLCEMCSSENMSFEEVSGKGKIYSYTMMHQRNVTGFENDVPYLNIIVELDEQPKLFMITNLREADPSEVKIGLPVEVIFEPIADGLMLPQFRLVK